MALQARQIACYLPDIYVPGGQVLQTPKASGLWGNSSFGNLLSKTFNELLGPEEAAEGMTPARYEHSL